MSSEECRDDNFRNYSSISKEFNYDTVINNETNSTCSDGNIIIWYDVSINKNKRDDQYSLSQLYLVHNSIIIFINEQECLEFIDKFQDKNKLFLIVSGSLGKNFVPKICDSAQINSIYIFCGKKSNHEYWAKKYKKIKGVFDKIPELCEDLKQKLERDQMCRKLIDSLSKKLSSPYESDEIINLKNPKYDDDHHQQPKDDIKTMFKSTVVPFSIEEPCSPTKNVVEISNSIHPSETVTPYTQHKQQMEFSDTGIWPCVSVINSARDALVNHLHSAIETVKYFNSIDNFLQHIDHHPVDPHLIVISNPTNVEQLSLLIRSPVRRVYIYCSNNRLNEYDAWSERHSHIVSVLQHFDTLTRLILWDLSACIVDIANYYASENKTNFAQTRYHYAYRLHVIVDRDLNNRIEMMKYTQPVKFNN